MVSCHRLPMFFFALLGLITMGLLAAEAFSSRRMNRSLWRDGFLVTVTRERLGIGRTPSEVDGLPANPWRAEVWVHGEDGQLPRSIPFVKARLGMPPPARVHLLDGSLYAHAGPADYRELDRMVRTMVDYARELADAARGLRAQAFETAMGSAPQEEQRLQALDLLLTHFPSSLEADLAAKDGLTDPARSVRLRAARALGEAGWPVVHAILLDDAAPGALRVEALAHLSRGLVRSSLVPLILQVLESGPRELQAEASRISGQLQMREAVPALLLRLRQADTAERRELLLILGRIGDARAEPVAMAHLDHDDPEVCREAVRCLGRVGRPATVVPRLRAWLKDENRPRAVRELAEAVVGALGAPVDGRGRLSLVTDDGLGAVSVPDQAGAMAMISEPSD